MSTTTIATLKTTSINLLKVALLTAMLGALATALPANLTRIDSSAARVEAGTVSGQV